MRTPNFQFPTSKGLAIFAGLAICAVFAVKVGAAAPSPIAAAWGRRSGSLWISSKTSTRNSTASEITTTSMKRERTRRARVGVLIGASRCTSSSSTVWLSSSDATEIVSRPKPSSKDLNN